MDNYQSTRMKGLEEGEDDDQNALIAPDIYKVKKSRMDHNT